MDEIKRPLESPECPPLHPAHQQPDPAFELWLQRSLHQMCDDIIREPMSGRLLRLIEGSRKTGSASGAPGAAGED